MDPTLRREESRNVAAIRFSPSADPVWLRISLEALSFASPVPMLYAVCGVGDALRAQPERFLWLGAKNPKIQLSRYLLRDAHGRVPAMDGAFGSARQIVRSIHDFLGKATRLGQGGVYILLVAPGHWEGLAELTAEPAPQRQEAPGEPGFLRLFGEVAEPEALRAQFGGTSAEQVLARQMILRAAASDAPVLITGETGTGKSRAARLIYECSGRRQGHLVELDCGAITPTLFEAELFGYVKGAFTGADREKPGLWETAHKGVLFLDEIGDMPLEQQVKVLRAVQTGRVRRIGDNHDRTVDTRVIAATNRNLASMLRAGTFRKDLYFRLCGFQIALPPLEARPEDVRALARNFWRKLSGPGADLSAEVLDYLAKVRFPGNVRMLKRVLEVLHDLIPPGEPQVAHVRYVLRQFAPAIQEQEPAGERPDEEEVLRMDSLRLLRQLDQATGVIETRLRHCFEREQHLTLAAVKSLRGEILVWRLRLSGLTQERLPFRDRRLLDAVLTLDGGLGALERALSAAGQDAGGAAKTCFRDQVQPALAKILGRLFEQLPELT